MYKQCASELIAKMCKIILFYRHRHQRMQLNFFAHYIALYCKKFNSIVRIFTSSYFSLPLVLYVELTYEIKIIK